MLGSASAINHLEKLLGIFEWATLAGRPCCCRSISSRRCSPSRRLRSARLSPISASAVDPARNLPVMVIATGRSDVLEGLLEAGELAHLTDTYALMPMPLDRVPTLGRGSAQVAGLNVERGARRGDCARCGKPRGASASRSHFVAALPMQHRQKLSSRIPFARRSGRHLNQSRTRCGSSPISPLAD